jgi:hypothetical protein
MEHNWPQEFTTNNTSNSNIYNNDNDDNKEDIDQIILESCWNTTVDSHSQSPKNYSDSLFIDPNPGNNLIN